jgi:hypothetical protein
MEPTTIADLERKIAEEVRATGEDPEVIDVLLGYSEDPETLVKSFVNAVVTVNGVERVVRVLPKPSPDDKSLQLSRSIRRNQYKA